MLFIHCALFSQNIKKLNELSLFSFYLLKFKSKVFQDYNLATMVCQAYPCVQGVILTVCCRDQI